MASSERPQILLLSLAYRDYLDEIYASLFYRLLEVATLRRVKTVFAALRIKKIISTLARDPAANGFNLVQPPPRISGDSVSTSGSVSDECDAHGKEGKSTSRLH
ncbi:hypothetical protein AnigIFM60653_001657 [Aspergillus niger]|nr:hypothetical protein AnigIFM60653_001657 [Aspergillus niger]